MAIFRFSLLLIIFNLLISCSSEDYNYDNYQKDIIINFLEVKQTNLYRLDPDSVLKSSLKIIDLCSIIKNDTLLVDALLQGGKAYSIKGNYDSCILMLKKSYNLAHDLHDTTLLAVISHLQANNHIDKREFPSAQKTIKDAIANYSSGISESLNSTLYACLGDIYYRTNRLDSSMIAFQIALKYYGVEKDKQHSASILNNISNIYADEGLFDKAIITLQQAISINDSVNDIEQLGLNYGNLALLYKQSGNYSDAVFYLKKSIELNEQARKTFSIIISKFNLGNTYILMGEYTKASNVLTEVYDWSIENNNIEGQIRSLIALAKIERDKNNSTGAIKLFQDAMNLCDEKRFLSFKRDILFHLASIHYSELGDSTNYLAEYKIVLDSINQEDIRNKILEIEAKYEIEKAEEEIKSLKEINRIDKARKQILIILIILLALSVILVFIIYKVRNKNLLQAKLLLEQKQENQNLRLLDVEKEALIKKEEAHISQLNLKLKEQEVIYHTLSKVRITAILTELSNNIKGLMEKIGDETILKELKSILSDIESISKVDTLREFEKVFKAVHPDFYSNLLKNFPDLTPRELLYCAFLRLNMQTKDIAILTNNSTRSLETSRYRIRKKLGLATDQNLSTELMKY